MILKKFFDDSTDLDIAKDLYGWRAALFRHVRSGDGSVFLHTLSEFAAFLGSHPDVFPPVCASLLAAGALTPLHKLPLQERSERAELALPPKLRPINSGTMLTKCVLSVALSSAAAARAAEQVLPHQLSLGVSRSCERIVHAARAAHGLRFLVAKNDYGNGFNTLSRQTMLDVHAEFFPEAVNLFNFFYGVKAPAFVLGERGQVHLLFSEEGSRQGCAAGTEAFCLPLSLVVHKLQQKYPDFEFRVLTDDIIPLVTQLGKLSI